MVEGYSQSDLKATPAAAAVPAAAAAPSSRLLSTPGRDDTGRPCVTALDFALAPRGRQAGSGTIPDVTLDAAAALVVIGAWLAGEAQAAARVALQMAGVGTRARVRATTQPATTQPAGVADGDADAADAAGDADEPLAPVGFSFSPGGLLFPYYVGVAYGLQALGRLERGVTAIGGSSAGAIVAVALACGLSEASVVASMQALVEDVRDGKAKDVALREQLDLLLDDESHLVAMASRLTLSYCEVWPRQVRHSVSSWSSKEDLIDVTSASCNWPIYYTGGWPLVKCRGAWAVDGFFAVDLARFGCPVLPAQRTVAVTCLPTVDLTRAFAPSDIIQPGSSAAMGLPVRSSASVWSDEVTAAEWFTWAVAPATDEQLKEMVALGKQHAALWAEGDAK